MTDPKDPRLDELQARRESNVGKQVNNVLLPAGAPMHYYCAACGAHVATKPEDWYEDPPPKYCTDCQELLDDDVIDDTDLFDDWQHKLEQET